ncbi:MULTISPECIES: GMC family oxidoreductase [unclassified Modestobacter]
MGATRPLQPSYDVVVVGGGSAGCVLANRLSGDAGVSVLLVEAGPSHAGLAELLDAGRWATLLGGRHDWGYDYAPTDLVDGRVVAIPRGRVLGGSSSINAMLWYRGHPSDYDAWAAAGAPGWDWAGLLPYFRRSEDWEGGASALRGAGGPMRVETSKAPHPVAEALLGAAAALGLPVIEDANGPDNEGATLANFNATTGPDGRLQRWSTVRGYLEPVLDRPNLTVLTGSVVRRVILRDGRAVGIEHTVDGLPATTAARSGVVLTAGAIDTPRLLMLSGIGDPADLTALGIRPEVPLPAVGRGYQDHPLLMGMNFRARGPLGPVRDNGGGSMLNWRSSLAGEHPDLHAFVVQGPHASAEVRAEHELSGDVFAVSPGLMRSRSRGHVRLRSADPEVLPEVQPNFLAEPADLEALVESVDTVMDLLATGPYRALSAGPAAPDGRLDRVGKVRFIRRSVATFFHSCGTAAMGSGEEAVVDPELAVRGVDGLWVADASVFPVIPTCNTQWPVIAVAERAAELIGAATGAGVLREAAGR